MKRALLLTLSVTAVVLTACGDDEPAGEAAPAIDERAGSYGGVTIEDPVSVLDALPGECQDADNDAPCGLDATSIVGPTTLAAGWSFRNFEDVTYIATETRVKGFLVTREGARTTAGVAVGDDLDAAGDLPGATCKAERYEDSVGDQKCVVPAARQRWVIYGGDPINAITVAVIPTG
jgi:hypothetical protein